MRSEVVTKLGYMGPPASSTCTSTRFGSRGGRLRRSSSWPTWSSSTCTTVSDAPVDESYEHSTGLIPRDCERYNAYCDDPDGLNADIRKLGGVPFTEEGLAEFNRRLNIPRKWGA